MWKTVLSVLVWVLKFYLNSVGAGKQSEQERLNDAMRETNEAIARRNAGLSHDATIERLRAIRAAAVAGKPVR